VTPAVRSVPHREGPCGGTRWAPCLHAASTGELTEIADTRTETRWPDHARRAAEHGNLSSLSVPLVVDGDRSGALNVHARAVRAFDDSREAATAELTPGQVDRPAGLRYLGLSESSASSSTGTCRLSTCAARSSRDCPSA
jgi:hypothetical protein